jgi:hypothetical protein
VLELHLSEHWAGGRKRDGATTARSGTKRGEQAASHDEAVGVGKQVEEVLR